MKLSHLTIAISAAIGLAACGGSGSDDAVDNNTNPTTPTNPTPTNPTPTDPTPSTPDVDQNGLEKPVDPKRQVPTGEVEANVKPQVDAAKKAYVDRQTRDSVTGYNIIQGGSVHVKGQEIHPWAVFEQNRTESNSGGINTVLVSQMATTQDGSVVAPDPLQVVGLNARPAYARALDPVIGDPAQTKDDMDMAVRDSRNTGITYAVAARAYRNAGYPAYAQQELKKLQGVELVNQSGQAGLIFYTGATKVENPANKDNNGDLQRDASIVNYSQQTQYLKSNGGIQANPNFSYAKVGGDYYRVVPENVAWSDITPSTTFRTVVTEIKDTDKNVTVAKGRTGIPMSEILYIPNVALSEKEADNEKQELKYNPAAKTSDGLNISKDGNIRATGGYVAGGSLDNLGTLNVDKNAKAGLNIIRGSQLGRIDDYSIGRGNVEFKNFTLAGKTYSLAGGANFDNVPLDLSAVPSSRESKEVTQLPIGLNYTVLDAKATGTKIDDQYYDFTATAGALKIYELPYHRSIVAINEAAVENPNGPLARTSNMFGFAGYNDYQGDGLGNDGHYGPFQVLGYNQGTLPENGRADYRGKSFGLNSEGVLNLRADFGKERASVYGAVTNRKRLDPTGAALPDLNLKPILLSQPAQREHYASVGMLSSSEAPNGTVSRGSNASWGTWAMSFYGPNAEEVGGVIAEGTQLGNAVLRDVKEVFSGERGRIIGSDAGSASGSLN